MSYVLPVVARPTACQPTGQPPVSQLGECRERHFLSTPISLTQIINVIACHLGGAVRARDRIPGLGDWRLNGAESLSNSKVASAQN
jgi:hypothetical protein